MRGFKRKTIEKTIYNSINGWIKSLPEEIRSEVKNSYIVTGGSIASMLQGELPNDYDVYFDSASVAEKVAKHYVSKLKNNDLVSSIDVINHGNRVEVKIKSAGAAMSDDENFEEYRYFEGETDEIVSEYFEQKTKGKPSQYKLALITSNAISLHGDIQLIIRFCGSPEEIHMNFDFVHCTNWYTEKDGLILNQAALESILSKELKYVGSLYPLCTIFRIKKFIERGWTITAGEQFKICYDISKLNLNDPLILQDQLTGVDAAYFEQVLSILRKETDKILDRTYLFELINRVFDSNNIPNDVFVKTETENDG